MNFQEKNRIILTFAIFFCLFLLVASKAFYVQVINKEKLLAYSNSQTIRVAKEYPNRGNIYDRHHSPLAINVQTYSIFTIPKHVSKDLSEYQNLAKIVPSLSLKVIKEKIFQRDRYTWLARKIGLSEEQVAQIKKLPGIFIDAVPKRIFPNHELLGHVLGFVGVDNLGMAGLEYQFNDQLQGEPQVVKYLQDAKGRPVRFETPPLEANPTELILTIDKDLQSVAEKALKDAVIEFQAERGGIGVMDATNGEILAMANYPSFDPENVTRSKDAYRLPFISDPFEPGSVFKPLTVASALENKVVRPDANYYCERGKFKVDDHIISEADAHKGFEWLSVQDILRFSSNIGITKIAFDLTYPRLKKTLKDFGFGEKTGISLPAESRGIFNDVENVSALSLSNISFGQGIAVSALQMLAAFVPFANGGIYYRPKILLPVPGNLKVPRNGPASWRVISENTAREVRKMLETVVESGTGKAAQIPPFKIAGKTGTAQKASPNGGYHGYISSFIGMPVDVQKPFVIFVYLDNPRAKQYYGGTVAAPVFKKVAQYLLYQNKEYGQLAKDKKSIKKIMDQVAPQESTARTFGKGKVPNFIGLDKISALHLARGQQISIVGRGMGVVTQQSVKPGGELKKDEVVTLQYQVPNYE